MQVSVIDDLSTGSKANLDGLDVRLIQHSILEDRALDLAIGGADAVVHLAALGSVPRSIADPRASHDANTNGTLAVLEAVRRNEVAHLIVASSSSVYGGNPVLPKHEDLVTRPLSPYAASKLATEAYSLAWASSYGLPLLAFRFFNVFGPLQPAGHAYAAVIPAFTRAALLGEELKVHGDGQQSRDFTFVGSVVNALATAIERRVSSETPVNLAFGTRVTLLDVIDHLEKLLGRRPNASFEESRAGDVRHSQADTTRLKALIPDIEPVPFADGLEQTVAWMKASLGPAVSG
jgi:UDP-glucose 4-epimerase